jgi:succinate dehydrogenase / fumarate reductase membrane anchor subunit
MLNFLATHPDLTFEQWQALFDGTPMKLFSLLAVFSLAAHAWIGMWTVASDYLNERQLGRSAVKIRFAFQAVCAIALFVYVFWGIQIIWGL